MLKLFGLSIFLCYICSIDYNDVKGKLMRQQSFLPTLIVGMLVFALAGSPALAQDGQKFADPDLLVETMKSLDDGADDTALATAVANLSDDQVLALNRSLNNQNNNTFTAPSSFQFDGSEFDAVAFLERVTSEDLNKQQINALTKALEEKIKFLFLAEKTGNDKFLEKAESQEQKFLAKVDGFGTTSVTGDATTSSAKLAAKAAKKAAKQAAKNTAKNAAKKAAKQAVKDAIKNQAKNAAKGKKS